MKRKNTNKILTAYTVACFAALAIPAYFAGLKLIDEPTLPDYVLSALYALAGLFACYLFHNILHETFHALFARLSGAKVLEIAFCGLVFSKVNKRRFTFDFKSGFAGWTTFVCKRPETAEKTLLKSLVGGLVGSLFALVVPMAISLVFYGYFTYYFVFIGSLSVAYMLVINYVWRFDQTDGLLLSKKGQAAFNERAALLKTESALYSGLAMGEVAEYLFDEQTIQYLPPEYRVLLSLERGDVEGAKNLVDEYQKTDENADNQRIDLLFEKIFIACVQKDQTAVEGLKTLLTDCEQDSLTYLRAHLSLRRFMGETAWAAALEKTYYAALSECPLKGLARTEMKIYERFLSK
ncbi:MAG: hypothetical protein IJ811_04865 [Clostridia bacterium]|nr:hypothetical protein [Clostridia bacterium]